MGAPSPPATVATHRCRPGSVPQRVPKGRPSRQVKAASMDKTREVPSDLWQLMDNYFSLRPMHSVMVALVNALLMSHLSHLAVHE